MHSLFLEQKYQKLQKDLITAGIILVCVVLIGTLWYHLIEKWPWLDSLYMTVITLTTVGFGEIHQLGDRGRIFTMTLILMGVITIGYIVNRFTDAIIEGYFKEGIQIQAQKKLVNSLNEHYIICGFGRMGQQIALEFEAEGISFIIVDSRIEQIEICTEMNYIAVQGDATLDETLIKVGIEKAICLVAALASDADNLYTILSAKTLNPDIRAIARASTEEAVKKLQRAGSDAVVSPYITGGRRMAAAALRPQVMDFVDGILTGTDRSFYMEEFLVNANTCTVIGQTLREAKLRSQSGALVLAIRRNDGNLIAGPTGETSILAGDALICMGTAEQLRELNQILSPVQSRYPRVPKHLM